jgi:hypothetical protein
MPRIARAAILLKRQFANVESNARVNVYMKIFKSKRAIESRFLFDVE